MKKSTSRVAKAGIIICILVSVLMTSAQGAYLLYEKATTKKLENKEWTTLYYIDNDYNSLCKDPLEQIYIDEIATTEHVNVVVIQDTLERPAFIYFIDENHTKIVLEELGEVNMADYQTLKDFILYGKQHYPADRYLLWVCDHGGAWKGACMDETSNELALIMDGFQQALTETGGVDIICFFACLMGSLESVYELRDLVDVFIGSEDLAYGSWWDGICGDTNQLLTDTPELSNEEIGSAIVYFFPEHNNPPSDKLTMSALQADKVETLVGTLDALAKHYMTHWFRSYGKVKKAYDKTYLLADFDEWAEVFEVYDLKGFIQALPDSSKKDDAVDAFEEVVIAEVHGKDKDETNGLSIFFQARKSEYKLYREYTKKENGLDFPNDTWWNEFLFFFIVTNRLLRK